jgi:putative ABC transport system permease protein
LKPYFFHISLYDLASLGTLFSGLTVALLLGFTKKIGQTANMFLSLALAVIVLKTGGLTPLFLPALGPLLYFYVRQQTCPDQRFHRKDALHFCPLLVGFWMPAWLVLISVIIYIYLSHRLIEDFYRKLRPVLMDRPRFAFRRLDGALLQLGLFCVLSLFADPFYLTIVFAMFGMAVEAMLKPDGGIQLTMPITDRSDAKERARRLKEAVAANRLYEDPELTLATLAEKLKIHPHDLSRIINMGLEKNFSDFINEFRVRDIARKMEDPANDRVTLLGIAYDSGFNSKTTFNRVFKEMTGKTPVEYKNSLKNEVPIDKLALRSRIRPVILRSGSLPKWAPEIPKRKIMIKNYLKIAYRQLLRQKMYSIINIGGLATGMAVSFMLLIYVYSEFSFDKFYPHTDRLYQVFRNQPNNHEINTNTATPILLAPAMQQEYPDIEKIARTNGPNDVSVLYDNKLTKVSTMAADPAFLSMFDVQVTRGNIANPFPDISSIIITESEAKALFGNANPIGQTLLFGQEKFPLKVTAVINDPPQTSSFSYKAIISWQTEVSQQGWMKGLTWDHFSFQTYALLKPGVSVNAFNSKFKNIIGRHDPNVKENTLFLYAFTRTHLYSQFKNGVNVGGSIEFVRLFLYLAIGILLIACINFMNLSTARSEKRAREVGVRKAIGAHRTSIIQQFLAESLLMAFLSFALSIILIVLLLPVFSNMINIRLAVPYTNIGAWLSALGLTLLTGLLAGSYPAFFLSSFRPVKVLKGQVISSGSTVRPRQALVVVQFTFAICLILSSIFIYKQLDYIKNRPVGYSREGLVEMDPEGDVLGKFEAFRQDALNTGAVTDAAITLGSIASINSNSWGITWPGQLPGEEKIPIDEIAVTYHFIHTYGLTLTQGRDFDNSRPADSAAVILNEAAVHLMRFRSPLGQLVKWQGHQCPVVGVVKNFVWGSPYEPVKPAIIGFKKDWAAYNIGFRLNPRQPVSKSLSQLQSVYKKYNPQYPFEYKFTSEQFENKFRTEKLLGSMASIFTCLAIIISCLGLFALASFSAEQRKKEMSIRKVLGATTGNIWLKLSQEFLMLVLISFMIGSFISLYNVKNWLDKFTYHTAINWWVFAATGLGAILIALLTVSFQSVKAALANPVKSLRSE